MKNIFLSAITFLCNIILAALLLVIVAIFTIRFTFLNPEVNAKVADYIPVKTYVEDFITQEAGAVYEMDEQDEVIIKNYIRNFVVSLTNTLNGEADQLEIDLAKELESLVAELDDPILKTFIINQMARNGDINKRVVANNEVSELIQKISMINLGINKYIYVYMLLVALLLFIVIAIDTKNGLKLLSKTFARLGVILFGLTAFVLYVNYAQAASVPLLSNYFKNISISFASFGFLYLFISFGIKYYLRHNCHD